MWKYELYMDGKKVLRGYSKVSVLQEQRAIERLIEVNGWRTREFQILEIKVKETS